MDSLSGVSVAHLIIHSMAVRAEPSSNQSSEVVLHEPQHGKELTPLQEHAARLFGTGMDMKTVRRTLQKHLCTDYTIPEEQQVKRARAKLRAWTKSQKFRDAVYNHALVEVDMDTPGILAGIVAKAKRGRVDAARLALEITGRHNPKGETNPPTVVVQIDGIRRPEPIEIGPAEIVQDAELEE